MSDTEDLAELFRQEANSILDMLGETLLDLEHEGSAADARTEALRHFHTLKGMANMEGHTEFAQLCHEAETTLTRSGDAPVDLLLHRVDEMKSWLVRHGLGARKEDEAQAAAYVSVQTDRLDSLLNIAGELTVTATRLSYEDRAGKLARETLRTLSTLVRNLQDEVMRTRLLPARTLFGGLPRLARDTAITRGVDVDLVLDEGNIGLDRSIVDRVSGVLAHLIQNSIAHGIEPPQERLAAGKPSRGTIRVQLHRQQEMIAIRIEDDGRGLQHESIRSQALAQGIWTPAQAADATPDDLAEVLFAPGFSTSASADTHAGRGIGLTAVRETIRELGGHLQLASTPGEGTIITIDLPPTVALLETLVAKADGATIAVPVRNVRRIRTVAEATMVGGALVLLDAHGAVPLVDIQNAPARGGRGRYAIVIEATRGTFALVVDELLGTHATILKPLDPYIVSLHANAMGAAVLGSGTLAIVVDPNHYHAKV